LWENLPTSNYDQIGKTYGLTRQEDPKIARLVLDQIDTYQSVLNVGAGTGSYEPSERFVVAAELSWSMIRQRRSGAAPAVQTDALQLPFPDNSFEVSLAVLTLHHWKDWRRGLHELYRVASKRIVILTWFPLQHTFWLCRYFPELWQVDMEKFPTPGQIEDVLGPINVTTVPIPYDCADGFLGSFWRRPEAYLDDRVRSGISSFHHIPNVKRGAERLKKDLVDGSWHRDFGYLLELNELDLGYRILVHDKP
jgi:SAM-dependent methyltransferase